MCLEMVSPWLNFLIIEDGPSGCVTEALLAHIIAQGLDGGTAAQVPVLCPRLEHVQVYGSILKREEDYSAMIVMLESRFYHNTPKIAQLKYANIGGTFGLLKQKRADISFVLEGGAVFWMT